MTREKDMATYEALHIFTVGSFLSWMIYNILIYRGFGHVEALLLATSLGIILTHIYLEARGGAID
ncbi:MAG: hypothetical protein J7L47_11375 [Candidatus Odinarchaeota archaeon]|nr:hypothetical protein [Candidatus Odinarchaeota archaeon]